MEMAEKHHAADRQLDHGLSRECIGCGRSPATFLCASECSVNAYEQQGFNQPIQRDPDTMANTDFFVTCEEPAREKPRFDSRSRILN